MLKESREYYTDRLFHSPNRVKSAENIGDIDMTITNFGSVLRSL